MSQAKHKREAFWQITFPVCIVGLLLLAFTILIGLGPAASASLGADISLIFILFFTGIFVLPFIVLLAGLTFGIWKINRVLPQYTYLVYGFFLMIQTRVNRAADGAVKPIMALESKAAGLRTIIPAVRRNAEHSHSSSEHGPVENGTRRDV